MSRENTSSFSALLELGDPFKRENGRVADLARRTRPFSPDHTTSHSAPYACTLLEDQPCAASTRTAAAAVSLSRGYETDHLGF